MQYQVLARKWRPQSFQELVGQEYVSSTLVNALRSGRIAHAFLFSGPRGSGKTTTARILAKALNCHAANPGEPCQKCVACTEITAGNCLDVLEIDAASNNSVDDVRDLIEVLHYRPARDRYKIYIVDEVHMLSTSAFNALLKTLEEPPPHVIFILATTEYHKIPVTILSRCQQYSFKLIRFPLILQRLREITRTEQIQISERALELIAFSSGGSMRDATSALDRVLAFSGQTVRDEDVSMLLGLVQPEVLGRIVRAIAGNDAKAILNVVGELAEAGQDLRDFCRSLIGRIRDLTVVKSGISDSAVLGIPESLLPEMNDEAGLFSREDLLRLFEALFRLESELRYASQPRFQLEMSLIELAHIPHLRPLEDLIADFGRLVEGKPSAGGAGPAPAPSPPRTAGTAPRPDSERRAGPAKPQSSAAPLGSAPWDAPPAPSGREQVENPGPEPGPDTSREPRELLERIAASVQKDSLEPILRSLAGAKLEGPAVRLDFGSSPGDFSRRHIRENLDAVAAAAAAVLGRQVQILLDDSIADAPQRQTASTQSQGAEENVLERAKREPVIQSFIETFPGPVKAEKLKP